MESKLETVKEHYEAKLKADDYFKEMSEALKSARTMFDFTLQSINDIMKSGRFSGTKLLEIASGATVHNIAIPSKQFTNIVQSDLVSDNIEELKKWHRGESNLDWTPFLDVVAETEGYSDLPEARSELLSRIRGSVKGVVRCDMLSDNILDLEELTTPETSPPYDLIQATLAVAAAAVDYESYTAIIKRFHGLLKKGGGLIICDFENGAPWQTGNETFNHIQLSIEQVTKVLDSAGFGNLDFKVQPKNADFGYEYDYDSLFCVAAEKL